MTPKLWIDRTKAIGIVSKQGKFGGTFAHPMIACEFNFEGICAGSGNVYQYGEPITDDTKCCNDWGASFKYFAHQTTTAPRFLREAYNGGHISYQDFSRLVDDYNEGKPVSINIFDAIKCVYGISKVDIAVVLGVSFGVVYSAKTKGFAKKRLPSLQVAYACQKDCF